MPAPRPVDGDDSAGEDGDGKKVDGGYDPGGGNKGPRIAGERLPTSFYAHFELDAVRGIKQLGEILQHVTAHLGADVYLHLVVRATDTAGYDDATRRTVSENVTKLGGAGAEFE